MPVVNSTASSYARHLNVIDTQIPANTLSITLLHPAADPGDVGVSHHAECIAALAILLAATDLTIRWGEAAASMGGVMTAKTQCSKFQFKKPF